MPVPHAPSPPSLPDGRVLLGNNPDGAAQVERLLTELWSQVSFSDGVSSSFNRVCLANLVVVGFSTDQVRLESFVAAFASSHPSRVLLALVDQHATQMTASVSAACQRSPSGGEVVCWEKITLTVPPDYDEALTSVIRALLVGRVATVVALALSAVSWPVLLEGVKKWGDLLVSDLSSPIALEVLYWDHNGYRQACTNWTDHIWEGLKPIRMSLAEAYEGAATRKAFGEASKIECAGPSSAVSRFILGWFMSRLGWVLLGPGDTKGQVIVRRLPGDRLALALSAGEASRLRFFQSGTLIHEIGLQPAPDSHGDFSWDNPHWPGIVIQAMHSVCPDRVFLSALDAAAQIERTLTGRWKPATLKVAKNAADLADAAASRFAQCAEEAIADRGKFVVALAGGSTPELLYRRLAAAPYSENIAWDKIEWFWGDERWVPHDAPNSNYGMVRRALLDHLTIPPERVHPIPTHHDSAPEAAEEYEATIRSVFGAGGAEIPAFDLILLGIGADGHTASWFPGTPLDAAMPALVWGGYVPTAEAPRVTLTPRVLSAARRILFLVSGHAKAEIVARTLYPQWEGRHPAARVELLNGEVEWFLDQDAAGLVALSDFTPASA